MARKRVNDKNLPRFAADHEEKELTMLREILSTLWRDIRRFRINPSPLLLSNLIMASNEAKHHRLVLPNTLLWEKRPSALPFTLHPSPTNEEKKRQQLFMSSSDGRRKRILIFFVGSQTLQEKFAKNSF